MKASIKDFKERLKEICRYDETEKFVQMRSDEGEGSPKMTEFRYSVFVYTTENRYCISAVERSTDDGYLGCTMSKRKPLAGEDWTRGRDLPDGKLCRETWEKIKDSIVRTELIELEKPPKQYQVDMEVVKGNLSKDGVCGVENCMVCEKMLC